MTRFHLVGHLSLFAGCGRVLLDVEASVYLCQSIFNLYCMSWLIFSYL